MDRQPQPSPPPPQPAADYARMRSKLVISVRRVCPAWLADRADDIVQEAMLRVLARRENEIEQTRTPPASYLWKVAYSATVDEIRRQRRRRESATEMEVLEKQGPVDEHGPLRHAAREDLARALDDCLARLREGRRLIVGFHLLGHSLDESEAFSGWERKRVQNLLYRGLSDLRQCLSRRGFRP